ncbi:hypothetical protein Acsp02_81920 [Actinoplanes sp. NBRC 103695]|nr:hypothetical protein Acsp02_81920 [Actinoplanes sp. NBRC 103695]
MLWSVAGSSCSGKTTAARACAELPGVVVHDFDEIGVPDGADLVWRQRSLETWLRRALSCQADGVDVILLSQSPIGEVLAAPSAPLLNGLAACLLDVADDERLRRLDRRDPGKWSPGQRQAFLNWAAWHRGHAADPGHHPEVLTRGAWPEMVWSRWPPSWSVTTIDTTGRTPAESAAALRTWIQSHDRH